MSTLSKSLKAAAGNAGGDAPNVADVFSTYLYDGTGATQTITNGIDLAGEGGMVWIKNRDGTYNQDHSLIDTERGATTALFSNQTSGNSTQEYSLGTNGSFNSNGFTIASTNNQVNAGTLSDAGPYVSWTFRKAPRFFDVVTYTGDGVAGREIAHDLGVDVGMILIKRTDSAESWVVFHKTQGVAYAELESTGAFYSGDVRWGSQLHSTTHFSLDDHAAVNGNGASYVAYLFAHDPVGVNNDGMIACGSYTIPGAPLTVSVGFEPQFLLIKRTDSTGPWYMMDTMRGFTVSDNPVTLKADASDAEGGLAKYRITNDGFYGSFDSGDSGTFIYMAIRAPMMVEPESGTEVFAISQWDGTQWPSGFPVDWFFLRKGAEDTAQVHTRLTGNSALATSSSAAESNATFGSYRIFDFNDGVWDQQIVAGDYAWMFKRAKGFFDVVAYTGNGTAGRTVNHSLAVAPEMMWVKRRDASGSWRVGADFTSTDYNLLYLGMPNGAYNDTYSGGIIFRGAPTDNSFTISAHANVNTSSATYIAYLFASLAGVSKVGGYTGNGSNQNIACGFSAGARFVMIKRTDSSGAAPTWADWFMWDTERGIVSGNDPHISLNTTAAQVTTDDSIDPQSAGFTVNQVSATNINVSSATYIFLAIA